MTKLKPRIRRGKNFPWLCVGGGRYAYGDTPLQAYNRWKRGAIYASR